MQSKVLFALSLVTVAACSGAQSDEVTSLDPTLPSATDGGASTSEGGGSGGGGREPADDSGVARDPGGPELLSVTTNVDRLTEGQTVRFVVLATHPGGLSNLVGGKLSTPDGSKTYGAFTADQQGTYSLDLTWEQIDLVAKAAVPAGGVEPRAFRVELFDTEGRKAEKTLSLALFCRTGSGMVNGRCDPWSVCEPPTRSCDEICGVQKLTCSTSRCTFNGSPATRLLAPDACGGGAIKWWVGADDCKLNSSEASTKALRCCCN